MNSRKSIGRTLMLIVALIVTIGMAASTAISLIISLNAVNSKTVDYISAQTDALSENVNAWLLKQITVMDTLAINVTYMDDISEESLKSIFEKILNKNSEYFDVYIGYPDGMSYFYGGWVPDYEGGWASYKRPWYIDAVNNSPQAILTAPYTDTQTGEMCISAACAITADNGELRAVVSDDMYITTVTEAILSAEITEGSYAFLTDENGSIFIHPNGKYASDQDDNFQILSNVDGGILSGLLNNPEAGKSGVTLKDYDGTKRIFTYRELPSTGWRVYTAVPASVMTKSAFDLLIIAVPVVIIMILLSVILVHILTKKLITAPIASLTRAANTLAKGGTKIEFSNEFKGELKVLEESFIGMAENIKDNVRAAQALADGNLNLKIKLKSDEDEMGHAIERLSKELNVIIGNIADSSVRVQTNSRLMDDISHSLSDRSSEQSQTLNNLLTSVNEINDKIERNAEKTETANHLSADISSSADLSKRQMNDMLSAVDEIAASSANISRIIKVINDIASQTNILALNAAVEAARAGAAGKGFAVVAEEVRNLAAKSAEAANETSALIESSITKSDEGAKIAHATFQSLETILQGVSQTALLIKEISADITQQSELIKDIRNDINGFEGIVTENVSNARQGAVSAAQMSKESDDLADIVAGFKRAD